MGYQQSDSVKQSPSSPTPSKSQQQIAKVKKGKPGKILTKIPRKENGGPKRKEIRAKQIVQRD